jgi:hypothetical protein
VDSKEIQVHLPAHQQLIICFNLLSLRIFNYFCRGFLAMVRFLSVVEEWLET